jgi:hypothetical protein
MVQLAATDAFQGGSLTFNTEQLPCAGSSLVSLTAVTEQCPHCLITHNPSVRAATPHYLISRALT